jgi:hypothetical protein
VFPVSRLEVDVLLHRNLWYIRFPGLALVLAFCLPQLYADTVIEQPLRILDPVRMAQGGSQTAVGTAYQSLFGNPAGLVRPGGLTLLSSTGWMHAKPSRILPSLIRMRDRSGTSDDRLLARQFTDNGFGAGGALGLGYAGGGVGLGFQAAFDTFLTGPEFPDNTTGNLTSEFTLAGGFAHPFEFGPVTVAVGGVIRPFVRIHSLIAETEAQAMIHEYLGVETGNQDGSYAENVDALNGYGLAVDAGLLLDWKTVSFGLAFRDIGDTRLNYSKNSLKEVQDALREWSLPAEASEGSDKYIEPGKHLIPMTMSVGMAYTPYMGEVQNTIEPSFHLDLYDPFGWADSADVRPDFVTRTHIGVQARLYRTFDLRMGLNQGHPTVGCGVHLGPVEMNAAFFTRELGEYTGDKPSSGASLNLGIRF